MTKHSNKAIVNIRHMNTNEESWGLCPTTVRAERHDLTLPVNCPDCGGRGGMYTAMTKNGRTVDANIAWDDCKKEGLIVKNDGWSDVIAETGEYIDYNSFLGRARHHETDRSAERFGYTIESNRWGMIHCRTCTRGKVWELVEDVAVDMHYPVWPEGTTFPSKYNHHDCELCGKNGIKSHTFPVLAYTEDGQPVGMFVGNACVTRLGEKGFASVDMQAKKHDSRKELVVSMWKRTKETLEGTEVVEVPTLEGPPTPEPATESTKMTDAEAVAAATEAKTNGGSKSGTLKALRATGKSISVARWNNAWNQA